MTWLRKVGRCRLAVSKPVWFQRLKLECDEPLSNFAFDFNLRRYSKAAELGNTDACIRVASRMYADRPYAREVGRVERVEGVKEWVEGVKEWVERVEGVMEVAARGPTASSWAIGILISATVFLGALRVVWTRSLVVALLAASIIYSGYVAFFIWPRVREVIRMRGHDVPLEVFIDVLHWLRRGGHNPDDYLDSFR